MKIKFRIKTVFQIFVSRVNLIGIKTFFDIFILVFVRPSYNFTSISYSLNIGRLY